MHTHPQQPDAPDGVAEPAVPRLPAHASTVTAEAVRGALIEAADGLGAIEVDASDVESVGQAVLQILIAARADAAAAGIPFRIINPSTAFVDRVARCRLAETIGLETGDVQ